MEETQAWGDSSMCLQHDASLLAFALGASKATGHIFVRFVISILLMKMRWYLIRNLSMTTKAQVLILSHFESRIGKPEAQMRSVASPRKSLESSLFSYRSRGADVCG